ncbi:patatin-like phospholipase family protein [Viridibacterium curvum]|uniref:Patatin-like phospholipase family protein n=1 Tax=Viridibacterium curvum TaxID=1101404 RepID=A0ABP9R700_9RHOO
MKRRDFLSSASALAALSALAACTQVEPKPDVAPNPPLQPQVAPRPKPRLGLALGGGAARGFAHIGVIKVLEAQGIVPDVIAGTSAGAVVGTLYAGGFDAIELHQLANRMEESSFTDWVIFDRGFLKGEVIERFVNKELGNRPLEGLKRRMGVVATDLASGEMAVFTAGNAGVAVRASASIPAVFAPVVIRGREFVDGGLVSPVPVRAARQMGADIVVAVDISAKPSGKKNQGTVDMLLDTMAIMGHTIGETELLGADVIIRPDIRGLPATNFQQRQEAILQGERAALAALPRIREKLAVR